MKPEVKPEVKPESEAKPEPWKQPEPEPKQEGIKIPGFHIVHDPRAGTLKIPDVPEYPILHAYTKDSPLITVGGRYIVEHDRAIKEWGVNHEWIDTHNQGGADDKIDALCDRIRSGRVSAVVILNELCGTQHVKRIVAACKIKPVTPYETAKRGTHGAFKAALASLEAKLKANQP